MIVYVYSCPRCGEYKVSENTFFGAVGPEIWGEVAGKVLEGGVDLYKVVAKFTSHCPRCEPTLKEHEVKVSLGSLTLPEAFPEDALTG